MRKVNSTPERQNLKLLTYKTLGKHDATSVEFSLILIGNDANVSQN